MSKYDPALSRTEELVVFLANNFPNKDLSQLVMHKLMYLVDKASISKFGKKITEGYYRANTWGPTHNYLGSSHNNIKGWVNIVRKGSKARTFYKGIGQPKKYSFSDKELSLIEETITPYTSIGGDALVDSLIETTHDEHWKELSQKKPYSYDSIDAPIVTPALTSKIIRTALKK